MTTQAGERRIKRVLCEDQIPSNTEGPGYTVGWMGVTEIVEVQENLGSYGITWYEVFKGDKIIAKLNATYVMSVEFI